MCFPFKLDDNKLDDNKLDDNEPDDKGPTTPASQLHQVAESSLGRAHGGRRVCSTGTHAE